MGRRRLPSAIAFVAAMGLGVFSLSAFEACDLEQNGLGGAGADAAPDRSPPNREQTILDVSMANVEAAKGYRPGPYSGPITLFLTREVLALYGKDLHEQWRRFGTGPFELCFTGDDHFRQLEPPNIDTVVEQLERRLGRQEGAPRPIVPAAARHRGGGGPAAGTRTGRGWRNPP